MSFHFPLLISSFVTVSVQGYRHAASSYSGPYGHPELENAYSEAMERFHDRRTRWHELRDPWFDEEYRVWQLLPWSWHNARELVMLFRHYHTLRLGPQCHWIVEHLHHTEALYQDSATDRDHEDPNATLYSIVRLLMLGSLSLTTPWILRQRQVGNSVIYPSREAAPSFSHLPQGRLGPYQLCPVPRQQKIELTLNTGWTGHMDNFEEIFLRIDELETGHGAPL